MGLAGLSGTYKLLTANEPLWFRELTEEDMTPAMFYLNQVYAPTYYFHLVDPIDLKYAAWCSFEAETITRAMRYSPDLCTNWNVVVDLTTNDEALTPDDTFKVTNVSCIDNSTFIAGGIGQIMYK